MQLYGCLASSVTYSSAGLKGVKNNRTGCYGLDILQYHKRTTL